MVINIDQWETYGLDTQEDWLRRDQLVMEFMKIPKIFHEASFHQPGFRETGVVRFLKQNFDKSAKNCAVLIGSPGTGKSYGAVAYFINKAQVVIERDVVKNVQAKFITAYELAELLNRKDYTTLDKLKRVRALFIDELGTEPEGWKGKDFQAHFENMFNSRYENGLLTILVSNFTNQELTEHYGERFTSRLAQYALGYESKDPDFRKVKEITYVQSH